MASRLVDPSDYDRIYKVLTEAHEDLLSHGGKPITKAMSAEKVADFIVGSDNSYILDEQYLVCYQVGTPWFSEDKVLGELLVIRLGNGGSFSKVTDFFKEEAKRHGCQWVMVGTLLSPNDAALSRSYGARGFTQSLVQLVMEID